MPGDVGVIPQEKFQRRSLSALLAAGLFGLAGCVSVAPLEPIKNPPTYFRSDNAVDVEFLSPAVVGVRCAERGTAFYGMPVFHAMACGNGKLITMPDPCSTFTGGAYAALACDARNEAKSLSETISPFLINASFTVGKKAAREFAEAPASEGQAIKVEFVHPASVGQRCFQLGARVVDGEEEGLRMCAGLDRIVLPNPCMQLEGGWYSRTLCHEMAHANGWAMDHPGGSFLSDKLAGVDPADVPPPRAIMASLKSGAPLRDASESPIHLAYAAARDADVQAGLLTQPAVLRETAPAARTDLRDVFAAISRAQAAVPDLIAEARTFAASFAAEDQAQMPLFAGLKLRAPSASDVFEGARLFEASLAAREALPETAVLEFADHSATAVLTPPSSDRLSLRRGAALHTASSGSLRGQENLLMAEAPVMPEIDPSLMLAGFSIDTSDLPAPMKLAAQQRALVLRRPALSTTETANPVEVAEDGSAELVGPSPLAPRFKRDVLPQRRDDEQDMLAAGV
jgi:hypothetical protein